MTDKQPAACPKCGSYAPHLHPSTAVGGEVELCTNDFHLVRTSQNGQPYIDAVLAKATRPAGPAPGDVAELIERLEDADLNSTQRVLGSRIFGEAAAALTAMTERDRALREALVALEAKAAAVLEAMDAHNEKHGTHLVSPALFQLGVAIAPARAILASTGDADNG